MEFRQSPEYPGLPDEFNRDYRETPVSEKKNNNLLKLLLAFVTLTSVVFPLTVTHGHSHSHPEIPDIPDIPDVPIWVDPDPEPQIVEYSIIGRWELGNEFYEFFEDGTGYWTNGKTFILLDWVREDNDYRIRGEGISEYELGKSMTIQRLDFRTSYDDGLNLMMVFYSYFEESGNYIGKFAESPRSYDLDNITPLRGKTISDILPGFWETMDYAEKVDDGGFYYLSYMDFSGSKATFDFASLISDQYKHFEVGYATSSDYPNVEVTVGEGTEIFIQFTAGNHSYSTLTENGFPVYYFIDEEGAGLLVHAVTSWAIMRKMQGAG